MLHLFLRARLEVEVHKVAINSDGEPFSDALRECEPIDIATQQF
jgi:hypothetical protein